MLRGISKGVWIILALAVCSAVVVLSRPSPPRGDIEMWTFARPHADLYRPQIAAWNQTPGNPSVDLRLLSLAAVEHRMLAGFYAGLETADLIEVERSIAGRAFTGPVESVGFADLTDRLRDEGLLDRINPPSLAPWTSRGRIFGLPHDVHPVMLGYRADILDGLGIDPTQARTWDDFARIMAPVLEDRDGDGSPDHYPLAFWPSDLDKLELLLLQGDARLFDDDGSPVIQSDQNAALLAKMVSWCVGPAPTAAEVPDFSASGNAMKVQGRALCYFMPDWMCDVWNKELPTLSGKIRLMPLPAWDEGGRHTSVWGGTMLAIPKTARDPEEAWRFAKHLYVSRDLARELYREGDIVTPVTAYWDDPVFDEPDPYFQGQAKGRMYIGLAPSVPPRSASPYVRRAMERIADAGLRLLDHARATGTFDPDALRPRAFELLGEAQREIERQMARTEVFREGGR